MNLKITPSVIGLMMRRHEGWTLIELLIVLVIISVMLGLVVWRVQAWQASQKTQRFRALSETWSTLRAAVSEQGMSVSCRFSALGWRCWSWSTRLSGKTEWIALTGFPWSSKALWPKAWQWQGAKVITIHADGRREPNDLELCHKSSCWALFAGKQVSR